ncbi:hypothetical protein BC939DRAFT_462623 [Gamsiella multidivaricata]|uniref:uncharacterized protein n=1 Tax=Gamsiella multidivaricata TaxID=101098 RepID=UPI00221EA512|nr:uncharacterized protein BC939DRAFT_462623 [Gamsiella multidivaricata]KAI7818592.1 hypothetical protein BC939DRAFT_462623 [Gamsiella multidivaricata]
MHKLLPKSHFLLPTSIIPGLALATCLQRLPPIQPQRKKSQRKTFTLGYQGKTKRRSRWCSHKCYNKHSIHELCPKLYPPHPRTKPLTLCLILREVFPVTMYCSRIQCLQVPPTVQV